MSDTGSLSGEVVTAWREHWPYFKLSVVLFVVGTLLGALLVLAEVDLFAMLGFEDLGDALPDDITTLVILVNNSIVYGLALLGALTFGLLTVVILLFNDVIVGYVVLPAAEEAGIDFVIVAIVPHGILELPAFFVASAVAFRLVHRFVLRISDRRDRLLDPGELRRIGLLIVVAWVVLAIAAAVEAHLTLWLIETLFPELAENEL